LLDAVRQRVAPDQLESLVRSLSDEPTASRLNRAREMLRDACVKLGKTAPEVSVEHNDLRVPPGRWGEFALILPLILSNAADHGLESDAARLALGKTIPARIRLSTSVAAGQVLVEVSDDGCGIDWERVRLLAKERGLAHDKQEDLERALFSEGFSLKTTISESSGRGVGLSAVREVLERLGGKIELETVPGRGTTWRFRYPIGKRDEAIDPFEFRRQSSTREVSAGRGRALTG
jgi:two-component system chemotaxis sensor kinase CheA